MVVCSYVQLCAYMYQHLLDLYSIYSTQYVAIHTLYSYHISTILYCTLYIHIGIEAALNARQYNRALSLVKLIDDTTLSRPYYITLGHYYEDNIQYELAEKCYLASGECKLAVNMHIKLGQWEIASKIASTYMNNNEINIMYINYAQEMLLSNRYKDAEKLYLTVKEYDLAIGQNYDPFIVLYYCKYCTHYMLTATYYYNYIIMLTVIYIYCIYNNVYIYINIYYNH